jgi:ornithine carbamoyltransferase
VFAVNAVTFTRFLKMGTALKHFLSIETLSPELLRDLLNEARNIKRGAADATLSASCLQGQIWALIFSKSSTRTRVSFEVAIRQLGGQCLFLSTSDIQMGRGESVADTARVLGRMVQGAVIRTFSQKDVEEFAACSRIPTINALTDDEHPCQIVADIQTIEEQSGSIDGKIVTFVGDGACNVARSWIAAAGKLPFELRIAAPVAFQPDPAFIDRCGANVIVTESLEDAAAGADVLYTDVWVSMGKEEESTWRSAQLARYRIDDETLRIAKRGAMVLHCLPAYRGKEITEAVFEAHADTIFTQAENRMHAQKAILKALVTSR